MPVSTPFANTDLPYRPTDLPDFRPGIGLVGCGEIAKHHLQAYVDAGYQVKALCDIHPEKARRYQQAFYPEADLYSDYRDLLADDQIAIVDVATHPHHRPAVIEQAIQAGKHVLSQKPFVTDLDEGERLAELADRHGVYLAVNQNGRWAPHFSYIREAIAAGWLGEIVSAHFAVHWDHSWVKGTPFEEVKHLILFDYAIHWFDLVNCIMDNNSALRVYASFARSLDQEVRPNLLAQSLIEYPSRQATLVFDGHTTSGGLNTSFVVGTNATIRSEGIDENSQKVTVSTSAGEWRPPLVGRWFNDGFHGAMAELMRAIAEKRQPTHSGRENLRSLALCFAAVQSAETHKPVVPGDARRMPG